MDQTIEGTANKDTQTAGGTKGFSLKAGAVSRYYLTAEYRSICIRNLRDMINLHSPGISHADLEPSRMRKDETNVKSIGDTLDKNWANPFSVPNELVSLSTSSVAPESVQQDLLNAKKQGEHAYKAFRMERLTSNQPSKQFHDRLQKLKLKTFSDVKKSRKVKASNKDIEGRPQAVWSHGTGSSKYKP